MNRAQSNVELRHPKRPEAGSVALSVIDVRVRPIWPGTVGAVAYTARSTRLRSRSKLALP